MKNPYTHSRSKKAQANRVELSNLIDEYLTLSKEMEEHNVFEKLKRMDRLKELMKNSVIHANKTNEVILHGALGDVTLSACTIVLEVTDKELLYKLLGHDKFLSLAQFVLKDLSRALNGEQMESVCDTHYGTRRLKHVSYTAASFH